MLSRIVVSCIATLLLVVIACSSHDKNKVYLNVDNSAAVGATPRVRIVVIDSCEYLESQIQGGFVYTHKGNCKFCQERLKKVLIVLKSKGKSDTLTVRANTALKSSNNDVVKPKEEDASYRNIPVIKD